MKHLKWTRRDLQPSGPYSHITHRRLCHKNQLIADARTTLNLTYFLAISLHAAGPSCYTPCALAHSGRKASSPRRLSLPPLLHLRRESGGGCARPVCVHNQFRKTNTSYNDYKKTNRQVATDRVPVSGYCKQLV
eukprot:3700469-Pyramimonas_sp.AAC.1